MSGCCILKWCRAFEETSSDPEREALGKVKVVTHISRSNCKHVPQCVQQPGLLMTLGEGSLPQIRTLLFAPPLHRAHIFSTTSVCRRGRS